MKIAFETLGCKLNQAETEQLARQFADQAESSEIKRALLDSSLSMVLAFGLVIVLVNQGWMSLAMLILLLSMGAPFFRIWRHRREILVEAEQADR